MSETAGHQYAGGCHCGAVRFGVRLPQPIEQMRLLECNCTICAKAGFIHLIVPAADFDLQTGDSALTQYRFGTGAAAHRFCKICGIKSFYVPRSHPQGIDINVRCLDGVDIGALQPVHFDGRGDWLGARAALANLE